jgi:UDP-N-acetylmuramate--alanine ligase
VTVDAVADAVQAAGGRPPIVVRAFDEVPGEVVALARPGDLVLTMGAGSIGTVGAKLVSAIAARADNVGEAR